MASAPENGSLARQVRWDVRAKSSPDHRRWEALYEECRPSLYRAAALMVGESEAEEILQETFARAMQQDDFFETIREPRAYLRTALARLAVSRIRRRAVWDRIRHRLPVAVEDIPDPAVVDLRRALLKLPAAHRAAIVMHHYYRSDYPEIASALGMEASSVGKLLTRARRKLRDELSR